ncbi:Carnitine O-acetyltransferase mitochondrial [Cystobasidiomycetes sp. EMM_F5]
MVLNDWLLKSLAAKRIDLGNATASSSLSEPTQVHFKLDGPTQKAIIHGIDNFNTELSKHKISVLQYNGYGKDFIKKCKTSPDSWAQLVMQYAYYKLSGYTALAGTYESAQTRKYQRGRTEVIRSATPEALAWVKAMEDNDASNANKLDLFRKAAAAHIKWAGWASDGQGIDRHFFGLKKLIKPGEEVPKIFSDPAFAASSYWTLSTSQLSSEFFDGWGYGQVVSDGFGLAYSVNNTCLRFTITTTNGKAEQMKQYLAEAAEEVREAVEKGMQEAEAPKAKL